MDEGAREVNGIDRREAELAEAMLEISLCIVDALHRIDPRQLETMNFEAGLRYNRLLAEDKKAGAELMLRFGRALLDKDRFPDPSP